MEIRVILEKKIMSSRYEILVLLSEACIYERYCVSRNFTLMFTIKENYLVKLSEWNCSWCITVCLRSPVKSTCTMLVWQLGKIKKNVWLIQHFLINILLNLFAVTDQFFSNMAYLGEYKGCLTLRDIIYTQDKQLNHLSTEGQIFDCQYFLLKNLQSKGKVMRNLHVLRYGEVMVS